MSNDNYELFGKKLNDCTKEELIMGYEFLCGNLMSFAARQDEKVKEENEQLRKENERLWQCLGAKK